MADLTSALRNVINDAHAVTADPRLTMALLMSAAAIVADICKVEAKESHAMLDVAIASAPELRREIVGESK